MSKELIAKSIFNIKKFNLDSNERQLNVLFNRRKNICLNAAFLHSITYKSFTSNVNFNYLNLLNENKISTYCNNNINHKPVFDSFITNKSNSIDKNQQFQNFRKSSFCEKTIINNNINNTNTTNINNDHPKKKVNFIFVYANTKKEVHVEAELGQNVLEIAHKFEVDLEGACDASLACSTCHVILEQEIFDKLTAAKEEEEDLLDLAFRLTHTSRLGCQVIVTDEFEGAKITIPSATRNLYVDGHKPKPH